MGRTNNPLGTRQEALLLPRQGLERGRRESSCVAGSPRERLLGGRATAPQPQAPGLELRTQRSKAEGLHHCLVPPMVYTAGWEHGEVKSILNGGKMSCMLQHELEEGVNTDSCWSRQEGVPLTIEEPG